MLLQASSSATSPLRIERHTRYWPERVEILESLPRTPSGKVQKFKLRDLARPFGDGT